MVIADFAPHDLEALRQDHAHRRLGFSDDEVRLWCEAAGLTVSEVRHLKPPQGEGEKLTVTLWLAKSDADRSLGDSETEMETVVK